MATKKKSPYGSFGTSGALKPIGQPSLAAQEAEAARRAAQAAAQAAQAYAGAPTPAPAAAPAAPAPPAAPEPIRPFDLTAAQQFANSQRDERIRELDQTRVRTLLDYGYKDLDGNPATADFGADLSNPLGRAAQLKLSYQRARTGDITSYSAAGQLRSGAYGRQQEFRNTSESTDEGLLLRSLMAADAAINSQRSEVNRQTESYLQQLARDWAAGTRPGEAPPATAAPAAPVPAAPAVSAQMISGLNQRSFGSAQGGAYGGGFGGLLSWKDSGKGYAYRNGVSSKGDWGQWRKYPDGRTVFVKGAS